MELENRTDTGFNWKSIGMTVAYAAILFYFASILLGHALKGSQAFSPYSADPVSIMIAWPVRTVGLVASYAVLLLLLASIAWTNRAGHVDGPARRAIGLLLVALGVAGFTGVLTHPPGADGFSAAAGQLGADLARGLVALSKPVAVILAIGLIAFAAVVARDWFFYKAVRRLVGRDAIDAESGGLSATQDTVSSDMGISDPDFIRPMRRGVTPLGMGTAVAAGGAAGAALLDLEPLDMMSVGGTVENRADVRGDQKTTSLGSGSRDVVAIGASESWEPASARPAVTARVALPESNETNKVAVPTARREPAATEVAETPQFAEELIDHESQGFAGLTPEMLATPIDIDDLQAPAFVGDDTDPLLVQSAAAGEDDVGDMDDAEVDTDFDDDYGEDDAAEDEDEDADEDDEDFDADDDEDVEFEDEEFEDEDEDEDDDDYDDNDIDEDLFARAEPVHQVNYDAPLAPMAVVETAPAASEKTEELVTMASAAAPVDPTPVVETASIGKIAETTTSKVELPPLWSAAAESTSEATAPAAAGVRPSDWAAWMDDGASRARPATKAPAAPVAAARSAKAGIPDALFESAVKVVLERDQCSMSLLQRHLRLSFADAAAVIERMEQEGIVGPYRGSGNREILGSATTWESRKG